MDFSLTEQQEMLRLSARGFLSTECPKARVRELDRDEKGYDPHLWHRMAELGWLGLVFPEEYGGMAGSFLDLTILMEEMGRNLVPVPFFSTIALCALPLLEYGTPEQKKRFLPQIAKGEAIWTLALLESSGKYEAAEIRLKAVLRDKNYLIHGRKLFVPDAHIADYILVAARTEESKRLEDGITLFIVDAKAPNMKIDIMPTIGGNKQCRVSFDRVRAHEDSIVGTASDGWQVLDFILQRAAVLKCAEASGACQAILDMANSYAKERIQFDRPIGSFQAIQHRLADMLIEVEAVQYLLYQAAWGISVGLPSRWQISAAKAKANQVFQQICIHAIGIHGAIGYTMDHDVGLYYRRAKAMEFAGGDSDIHREIVASELGL